MRSVLRSVPGFVQSCITAITLVVFTWHLQWCDALGCEDVLDCTVESQNFHIDPPSMRTVPKIDRHQRFQLTNSSVSWILVFRCFTAFL